MGWLSTASAVAHDERVILASIGLATFGLVSFMFNVLTILRDENIVPPVQPKTQYITQETEDALQLSTLDKLVDHPNYTVREVAVKILCDRAVNDPDAVTYLLYGTTRPDYDERLKNLRVLSMLAGQVAGFDGLSKLNSDKAYSALVRSLELCLGDTAPLQVTDSQWDEYPFRDDAEKLCLSLLLNLVNKYGAYGLIKAKFVEKWLTKQDWGASAEDRITNFSRYVNDRNNRVVDIVNRIKQSKRGRRALEKSNLTEDDGKPGRRFRNEQDMLQSMELLCVLDQDLVADPRQIPRTPEHSAEERRLRRQHREAMVLNDGSRPLGRGDIIERHERSPT